MAPAKVLEPVRNNGAIRNGAIRPRSFDTRLKVRPVLDKDPKRIYELMEAPHRTADHRGFDLLRHVEGARWATAEAPSGAVAGIVGAAPFGEIGILCHLAVRDGYRGMGLGTALSSWAVSYLKSWGVKTVRLYATEPAEGIYLSLGFEPVAHRTVLRLESAGRATAVERLLGTRGEGSVSRLSLGDLAELCGVDRRSRGADRAALILSTLRTYPGPGFVARDDCDRITGYLLSSAPNGTLHFGPFVASTPAVARALLAQAIVTRPDAPVEVMVPDFEGPAQEVLEELGFTGWRDRLRMELGDEPCQDGPDQYATTPYLST